MSFQMRKKLIERNKILKEALEKLRLKRVRGRCRRQIGEIREPKDQSKTVKDSKTENKQAMILLTNRTYFNEKILGNHKMKVIGSR